MSGGSYNYLCNKDANDYLNLYGGTLQDLSAMRDRLAGLGYAQDAAREVAELELILRQIQVRVEVMIKRLSPVFKAVEWWDSCDWSENSVKKALAEYRKI